MTSPFLLLNIKKGDGITFSCNTIATYHLFDFLLNKAGVAVTPGSGFGPSGEGYIRLTAFNTKENTIKAMEKLKTIL